MHPLDGAFLRLDRAKEHFAKLKALVDSFIDVEYEAIRNTPNLYSHTIEMVRNVIESQNPVVPARINLLVGEVAYNLRTALDYLVYELAIADSGVEQERTQFPIHKSPDDFWRNRNRFLKGVNDVHAAAIERLQPYHRGYWSHWLKLLRELSNEDKHMKLTVQKRQAGTTGHGTHDPAYLATPDPENVKGVIIPMTFHEPPHRPVYMKVHFTLDITLEGGSPLIDSLQEIETKVADTLAQFKPEF